MADVDVDALQNLVDHLNQKAKKFSDSAKTILDGAQNLDTSAYELTANPTSWVGKGAGAFAQSWESFHANALTSALHLDTTSQVLSRFASKLQDHVDNIRSLQAQMAGMALLTIGLGVVDVLQLGLDPVTDAATAGAGGGDAAIMAEISTEEDAIASLDGMVSEEIDAVTAEIEDSASNWTAMCGVQKSSINSTARHSTAKVDEYRHVRSSYMPGHLPRSRRCLWLSLSSACMLSLEKDHPSPFRTTTRSFSSLIRCASTEWTATGCRLGSTSW